ncbi:CONTINUOUS VASCULAR RING 1 protein [Nymphaea thermarum]|nr:CONTINUOUS VASCULAR RING 1 protein [Nymphaea thermarum]
MTLARNFLVKHDRCQDAFGAWLPKSVGSLTAGSVATVVAFLDPQIPRSQKQRDQQRQKRRAGEGKASPTLDVFLYRRRGDPSLMGDDRLVIPMATRERDRELLIPVGESHEDGDSKASSSSASSSHHSGKEAFYKVLRSWASKKFMTGCVILFPIAITFYITWWFIRLVDGFFSPIYAHLGINIFGLGFVTSIAFIFLVGVFMSSWLGASVLNLGEWFIKRMPFVRHIYNASKQISAAISPDQNSQAFKEVAIIRHPRVGEYAFGFITSAVTLQHYSGEEELCCVYVPTNHLYIGDIFLINSKDVIRPNLSVREGIEIVVSVGMSMPQILSMRRGGPLLMGDNKSVSPMAARERDRELLIPVGESHEDGDSKASSSTASSHHSGKEAFYKVIRSWASKKFMTGCVILFPIAITFYITWWFIHFVDGFFSPIYAQLGINIFGSQFVVVVPLPGLGFVTSITFIFLVGVFMSSWLGASVLNLGEWFIKRMPFVRHIYNASKQISAAISPDQNSQAFKEVAIIRHPRVGEYAFGFITSSVTLQHYSGEEELCCVYVPTNHLYIGDIFLINSKDVIRPNLSVREGIEIVVSGGMSMPQILSTLDSEVIQVDRTRATRS